VELRHLRYFVDVAEEGSVTLVAERRLHTAQPSLSRQIRDLEYEIGVPLLVRSVRGVELTDAWRLFSITRGSLLLRPMQPSRPHAGPPSLQSPPSPLVF
jgi:LysR family transcriptional regulator, hca operon transcriptional activator